jgi:phenylacetate-coenzyme A ligase PaaK-like adenylate-forming protein
MKKQLDKLNKIIENIQDIPFYENFYQNKKFKIKTLQSIDALNKIPMISKKNISGKDLTHSKAKISLSRATSGTTSNKISIFKRSVEDRKIHLENFLIQAKSIGLKKKEGVAILFPPDLSFIFGNYFEYYGCEVVFGNIFNLELSTKIFSKAKVTVLRTTPILAIKVGILLKIKKRPNYFKKIIISGSILSILDKEKLKKLFPDAKIIQNYGLAETGIIGWQSSDTFNSNSYHPFPESYLYEVIDPQTGKISDEGELVISTLWKKSGNILIRYRTGDWVKKKTDLSKKEGVFIHKGRIEFDIIKLKGINIHRDSFEKSLKKITNKVEEKYFIHIKEQETVEGSLPFIEVDLIAKRNKDFSPKNKQLLEFELMKNFQITPVYNWMDGVNKKIFLPIKINFVKKIESQNIKSINIKDHRRNH